MVNQANSRLPRRAAPALLTAAFLAAVLAGCGAAGTRHGASASAAPIASASSTASATSPAGAGARARAGSHTPTARRSKVNSSRLPSLKSLHITPHLKHLHIRLANALADTGVKVSPTIERTLKLKLKEDLHLKLKLGKLHLKLAPTHLHSKR